MDRWEGNPLQPLDVPGRRHVEAAEEDKEESQGKGGKEDPGTDCEDDGKDAKTVQTYLEESVKV